MPGFSQHSFTFDLQNRLRDSTLAAVTSSQAEADVLDFGNTTSAPVGEQVAYTEGYLVIDVSAGDFGNADEVYDVVVQLSDNASGGGSGFAGGDLVVGKVAAHFGVALGPDADPDVDPIMGRVVVKVDNERLGQTFRFMRIATVVAGTSPSLAYGAFFAPLS